VRFDPKKMRKTRDTKRITMATARKISVLRRGDVCGGCGAIVWKERRRKSVWKAS